MELLDLYVVNPVPIGEHLREIHNVNGLAGQSGRINVGAITPCLGQKAAKTSGHCADPGQFGRFRRILTCDF